MIQDHSSNKNPILLPKCCYCYHRPPYHDASSTVYHGLNCWSAILLPSSSTWSACSYKIKSSASFKVWAVTWIKHLFWDMTLLRPSLFRGTSGTKPTIQPVVYRGGVRVFKPHPPPRNSKGPPKLCQTQPDLWKLLKIAEFRTPTPQDVRKKGSKILKLHRFAIFFYISNDK